MPEINPTAEIDPMTKTLETPVKTRMPIWILILVPVLLAAAFYIGMNVGAGNNPVQENAGNPATPESHDASDPGSISLTEQARKNIGLTTAVADFR